MASFMLDVHSLNPSSRSLLLQSNFQRQEKKLPLSPTWYYSRKRRVMHLKKKVRAPVMALTHEALMEEAAAAASAENQAVALKVAALVTVKKNNRPKMERLLLHPLDAISSPTERAVVLQLVSTQLDPKNLKPKLSKEAVLDWSKTQQTGANRITHRVEFVVDSNFGMPGAITVSNKHREEFFLESVIFEGLLHFSCNSWIQPEEVNTEKRIFFANKAYLPCQTPEGLKELREKELMELRGDGKGQRKWSDRIYDYDMYNDLGDPDQGIEFSRPTLGGRQNPHPRRCRTGRPPTKNDVEAESRAPAFVPIYVPRDEALDESKEEAFNIGKLKGILRNVIPFLAATSSTEDDVLKGFSDIKNLYRDKPFHNSKSKDKFQGKLPLPNIFGKIQGYLEEIFKFDPPKLISGDTLCCLRDDEFGRQVVAGINPLSIQRLEVFPPMSNLEPSIYGPQESAIKEEHIIGHLNGMSVQQALDENKLFILDYHDIYLPFLNRINALDDRKAYGTRTLFFLTPVGTLKPIAIELSLPPEDPNSLLKQVLTPPVDATSSWLWQLGKAHVCSNDAGVHQLVNHWLRTHACIEPLIIAAHQQMSNMHPIFKLLKPHMRYTLQINALARESLINAGGNIESFFTPGKYCMEISCAAYRDWWQFDLEGLPADLIRRGVAVPDPTEVHGLRLLIEDYPYANDGLLIWSAIESLVQTYANYYYPDADSIQSDAELQAWYNEFVNVGHTDLCHSGWWPTLSTPNDLSSFLTTIIWIMSAQHAAVNFGQYPYGGFIPARPPLMRQLVPQEHDPEYEDFIKDPQAYFLSSLPSLLQATKFMAVIEIISAHSPDEEYLGERKDLSAWSDDTEVIEAFYRFSLEIRRIEKVIEKRNADPSRRNRCGAGI